jgi:signal transduction histidine kinase
VETQPLAEALSEARTTLAREVERSGIGGSSLRLALAAVERAEVALHDLQARASQAQGGPVRGEPGHPARVDLLERRIAELTRSVTLHDEFLSTLGHELRNPLAPIFMQAQYLLAAVRKGEAKALTSEWLVPQLEGFCRRLQRFLEMLNRIMDVSRMSAGQLNLELEEVDLAEIVREVSSNYERELVAARSELRLDLPPRLVGLWDRMRVEQIFTNLLSNAIRYGASKPIEVKLGGDAEQVELSVRDYGIGIPESHQSLIFERFERAGKTRSSGGFGIGLWTVRQSCLAMGGQVTVKSRTGEGSEFIAALPRVTEKEPLT